MKDPMLLYRCPGSHSAGGRRTYDSAHAKTQEDVERLKKQGYFLALPDALDAEDEAIEKAKAAPTAKGK